MDLHRLKIDRAPSSNPAPRRRWGCALAWLIVIGTVGGSLWLFRRPLLRLIDDLRLPRVAVVRARRASAANSPALAGVAANGYVVASKRAALSADTPGRIVAMYVEEGSVLDSGEVVARLFSDEYAAALRSAEADLQAAQAAVSRTLVEVETSRQRVESAQAERALSRARLAEVAAQLKLAELELGRVADLRKQERSSQSSLDEAESRVDALRASLTAQRAAVRAASLAIGIQALGLRSLTASLVEARARAHSLEARRDLARATLEKTEVRAPFTGVVVLKDAEVGEVVSPNSQGGNSRGSVATMVDFGSLEVQVELPEKNLATVEEGLSAHIFLDAYPQVRYTGRVERIWPTADRAKATIELRIGFDQPDRRLRPEMGCRVVFDPEDAEAPGPISLEQILVPESCVVTMDGDAGVFVLERETVRWRAIEKGPARGGLVNVASGLEGDELLVSAPPADLADGDRVRVLKE